MPRERAGWGHAHTHTHHDAASTVHSAWAWKSCDWIRPFVLGTCTAEQGRIGAERQPSGCRQPFSQDWLHGGQDAMILKKWGYGMEGWAAARSGQVDLKKKSDSLKREYYKIPTTTPRRSEFTQMLLFFHPNLPAKTFPRQLLSENKKAVGPNWKWLGSSTSTYRKTDWVDVIFTIGYISAAQVLRRLRYRW